MNGYVGKILKIDLTKNTIKDEVLEEADLKKYIGGCGLGAKYLIESTDGDTDPMGEENILIFMTGPLTNTKSFSSDRFEVVTKSPLGGYSEANCGGKWGSMLKRSGYDGIIISGKSNNPVYIWIDDGEVKIIDAGKIWGLDTFGSEKILKAETTDKAEVTCIGPGGENMVKYAVIATGGVHARVAARSGAGAVMGSKKLKAIVVYGTKEVVINDPDGFDKFIKNNSKKVATSDVAKFLRDLGTPGCVEGSESCGDLPIKNWTQLRMKNIRDLYGETMRDKYLSRRYYCGGCLVGCGRVVNIIDGKYKTDSEIGGPEYETLGMLGSNLMINNMEAVCKFNEMCNRYGIDTISTGSVIGMIMECYDRGLIDREYLDGIDMTWGNEDAVLQMINKIGKAEGIGKLLGKGTRDVAKEIGSHSIEFAVQVKGLEAPAHDPRAKSSLALAYATSNRGACHLQHYGYDMEGEGGPTVPDMGVTENLDRFTTEGKAEFVIKFQNLMSMYDSLTCCKFMMLCTISLKPLLEEFNLITGFNFDEDTFLETGERIFNLKRLYNTKCGISRKDDTLPLRILNQKRSFEEEEDVLPCLGKMLDEYYRLRDWDEIGIPMTKKLKELGINEYL